MGCLCFFGGSSEAGISTDFDLERDLAGEIEEVSDSEEAASLTGEVWKVTDFDLASSLVGEV